jgi:beta-N-acetylhexosaminidase
MTYLMIDIEDTALNAEDVDLLKHPKVGGIILFSRNYESIDQLSYLTYQIKALRSPPLMIAVDHEGGRVQRFRKGFTEIPPMRELGTLYDKNPEKAMKQSHQFGKIMGSELKALRIDCPFAPVLDIDTSMSEVIGNRSFHTSPKIIGLLASALMQGLHEEGVISVGKHFPGHGHVAADSHIAIPRDERTFDDIKTSDLLPFRMLIASGLKGIMPAHVIYEKCDDKPAGFSTFWLQTVLRHQLQFTGTIFSDDLSMEGATPMGNMPERVKKAKAAGCDMLLICNNRKAVIEVIENDAS